MMDGGTVWNANLASAIDRCREIVDRDEDIIMDVIVCNDGNLDTMNATGDTIENFLRSFTVSMFHNGLSDVRDIRRTESKVNYRYFFMASKPLASPFELLEFTPAIIQPMIDIGKEDAYTIVTTTQPGESFKKLDDWVDSPHIRAKYPNLAHYLYEKKEVESTSI